MADGWDGRLLQHPALGGQVLRGHRQAAVWELVQDLVELHGVARALPAELAETGVQAPGVPHDENVASCQGVKSLNFSVLIIIIMLI